MARGRETRIGVATVVTGAVVSLQHRSITEWRFGYLETGLISSDSAVL
jgi:hypothetical protein